MPFMCMVRFFFFSVQCMIPFGFLLVLFIPMMCFISETHLANFHNFFFWLYMSMLTNQIITELVPQKWSASGVVNKPPQYIIIYVLSHSISYETLTKKSWAKKRRKQCHRKWHKEANDKKKPWLFNLKAFYLYA